IRSSRTSDGYLLGELHYLFNNENKIFMKPESVISLYKIIIEFLENIQCNRNLDALINIMYNNNFNNKLLQTVLYELGQNSKYSNFNIQPKDIYYSFNPSVRSNSSKVDYNDTDFDIYIEIDKISKPKDTVNN